MKHRFAAVILLLALGLPAPGFSQGSAELPERIASALRAGGIPPGQVGLWVAPAAGGPPGLQLNADIAYNPASVMKLVTSSAALELLGPTYTWRTEALLHGSLHDGVLKGDLVLRGGGDPALSWERFGSFLRELRGRGLRDIRGDVLLDRSLFAPIPEESFDDQPWRAYNATPDALLINLKALSVRLMPADPGQTVAATSLAPLAPFRIDNRLRGSAGPCVDWRSTVRSELLAEGEGLRLMLTGSFPVSCGERLLHLAAHDGPRLAASIFRALWREMGGSLRGRVREALTPASAQPFAVWTSPGLSEVLRDINKFSNNVMARHLLITLAQRDTPPGIPLDAARGETALRSWLVSRGLGMPELVIENGSGLSRRERISAAGLGRLLQAMWASPRMPELLSSLPIAGEDGTARRRFGNQGAAGRAYLKTGSLNDVMSTAGYLLDASGTWQVFVLILHGPRAAQGEAATLAALEAAWQRAGR